jgi:hypothetical protein
MNIESPPVTANLIPKKSFQKKKTIILGQYRSANAKAGHGIIQLFSVCSQ